jgi:hypothetical protein
VVADYYDIPSIWVGYSPISGTSGFHRDESESWNTIEQASYEEMTTDEIERAEEFIERFRSNSGQIQSGPHHRSVVENIRQKAEIIRRHARDIGPYLERWIRGSVLKRVSAAYAGWKYPDYDESAEFVQNSDYVFYPLQYFRESRVLVRAPAFYKQSWLVEYLSRSVPHDHELFVKDHPNQVGAQPKSEIDAMLSHAQALDPNFSMVSILENASAVVVLNNTVGYEAILHGKPVVTLGKGFYTPSALTYNVRNINKLSTIIAKAISERGPGEKDIIEFAHEVIEGSFQGEWGNQNENNLHNLSISIRTFYSNSLM